MTYITGANTYIALKVASTFGTAGSVSTGDKMEVESLSQSTNPEELTANPIGSGNIMANDSQQGATAPSISIEKIEHYNDAGVAAEAVFFGTNNLNLAATGAYTHSFINNTTFNSKYLTAAMQYAASSVMEFPSCIVSRFAANYSNPPDYGRISMDLLANDRLHTGTTNNYAALAATTIADSDRVVLEPSDELLINLAADGALTTSTHRVTCQSVSIELVKEQLAPREIKGSTGNGDFLPVGSPPFSGTVTVVLSKLEESTWFDRAVNGTECKAQLTITGPLITGSTYKKKVRCFPRLKLIQDPEYSLSSSGVNTVTLVFKCLVASSAPTGMISTYPYTLTTNTRSTSYLA